MRLRDVVAERTDALCASAAFERSLPRLRQVVEIPRGPGGAVVFRRSAFLATGGFDPMYFLYFEDDDLSVRARALGWKVYRATDAYYEHPARALGRWEQIRRQFHGRVSECKFTLVHSMSCREGIRRAIGICRRRFLDHVRAKWYGGAAACVVAPFAASREWGGVRRRRQVGWCRASLEHWDVLQRPWARARSASLHARVGEPLT